MFEIGNSLREARLRQHLDFPELEHTTKIRAKYLRALEDERFELLPSHTYVKGFLRSYADSLGLDGQLYVDEYNSRYVIGEDELSLGTRRVPSRRRRHERRESSMVLLALTLIGVFTALVIAAWRFGGADDPGVRGLAPNVPKETASGPSRRLPAGTARLEILGRRGGSFVEVRRGSQAAKKPVYSGTIERGQKQRFTARVLWVLVRTPNNVVVKLNGNRVSLGPAAKRQGVFVTAKRVFPAERA